MQSCGANPTIDWLIFTDDDTAYRYPPNVKRVPMTFPQMQELVQQKFEFPVVLHKPYKLCDYKVAYGYLFEEKLEGYDFWGYCDVDVLFGNLRKFVTDDLLNTYDKLGHLGHLTLFRNTKEINRLFMSLIDGRERYKEVFSTPYICVFDEWQYPSINHIFLEQKKKIFFWDFIADIYPYDSYYHRVLWDVKEQKRSFSTANSIAQWKNGQVFLKWKEKGRWKEDEYLYVHFQKRKMKPIDLVDTRDFYVIPNRFVEKTKNLEGLRVMCVLKRILNVEKCKRAIAGVKYRLIEKTGPVRHWFRDKRRRKL